MLRASARARGEEVDVTQITAEPQPREGGVPHGELLVSYADAVVSGDEATIGPLRQRVREEMGDAELVDAAAVVGNFQRMVRIADGTGIPLDDIVMALSDDFRDGLGVERYAGFGNTPRRGVVARLAAPPQLQGMKRMVRDRGP